MRTSKEMADLVFQIRDEHLEKKNRFRIIKKVRKEGKAFRKKLRTIVVSKTESVKNDSFRYRTAVTSLLGVVGVGIGAVAMWQAIKEPLPDNIDPRPPIIVHTTASSQTITTINTTKTTVTLVTTVNEAEPTVGFTDSGIRQISNTEEDIITTSAPASETYEYEETMPTEADTTTVTNVTTVTTTTTEAVTVKEKYDDALADYKTYLRSPAEVKPMVEISGKQYSVVNNNIDKSEVDSYDISENYEQQISVVGFLPENAANVPDRPAAVIRDTIEVMEINNEANYIIVYYPRQDIYVLYALNQASEDEAFENE